MVRLFINWLWGTFQSADFMPHGHCYYWRPDMVWSHALADGVIATAYFAIPIVLLHIFRQRRTMQYAWIVGLFALFITSCGLTHVMDVITIWNPLYRLDAVLRIITALASVGTAIVLVKMAPKVLAIPTEEEWKRKNEELQAKYEEINSANVALHVLNKTLAERNHFIEKLMDTMPNTVQIFDCQSFRPVYRNKDMLQILGYSSEEIYAMGADAMTQLVHPDDQERRMEFQRSLMTASDQEIREVEFRVRYATGVYHWLMVRGSVFRRDVEGIPDQVIGISQDITALKETETNIREAMRQVQLVNEELYAANEEIKSSNEELIVLNETLAQRNHFIERITDTTPNSIYIFDLNSFQAVYTNKDLPTILGYSPEQTAALGASVMKELVHPEDYERRRQYYNDFVNAQDNEVREIRFRLKNVEGHYQFFLFTNAVFRRNSQGVPDQIVGISQDITPLKETEADLRQTLAQLTEANEELSQTKEMLLQANEQLIESEEKARLLTEDVRDYSIFRLTLEGNVASWNAGAQQIQGYQAEEIINKHCSIFFLPEAIAIQQPEYEMEKAQQEGRYEDEGWRVRKDGSTFWANIVTTALYNARQQLVGYSKIIRDLTQKVKNDELTQKNKALMAINADLDNFVYTASHDLKLPITNLEGLLAVLRKQLDGKLTEKDRQWVDMMDSSVLRLKTTIRHLTEISKIQKGIEEAVEVLEFEQLTEEIKQDLVPLIEQNQAVIHTHFQIPHIRYSPKNLRSILSNLISNAIKYRDPHRSAEVWVSTYSEGSGIVLTVKDNGLGLSEQHQKKLFTMFKRFHDHVEGTGIGLYMIKRIVENHGGKIIVNSQLGVGSTFSIYFA